MNEFWLAMTLQRLEQKLSQIADEVHEAKVMMQRLAVVAGLTSGFVILGWKSPEAQEAFTNVIRSFLLKH